MDWMRAVWARLPSTWPPELPPESSPGFWTEAARLEMAERAAVSQTCARLVAGEAPFATPLLDAWFVRRRIEFAFQAILAQSARGICPGQEVLTNEILTILLIRVWDSDGCIAFWNHAVERGGRPHPDNPDGTRPLSGM